MRVCLIPPSGVIKKPSRRGCGIITASFSASSPVPPARASGCGPKPGRLPSAVLKLTEVTVDERGRGVCLDLRPDGRESVEGKAERFKHEARNGTSSTRFANSRPSDPLCEPLTPQELEIAYELLKEIRDRLKFMLDVGLHYLTLDRAAPSLSGGEGQRIRLASQIGSGLVGVMYILDEPSIGLHQRDNRRLLDLLLRLRDLGNTVVVVEHDEETMSDADWIIDFGPGAGIKGGEVVFAGTPEEIKRTPKSLTGQYLSGQLAVISGNGRRNPNGRWLELVGVTHHNLKNVDVRFPLGCFTCITGVSGSGKSSLITETLYPALARALHQAQERPGHFERIEGLGAGG